MSTTEREEMILQAWEIARCVAIRFSREHAEELRSDAILRIIERIDDWDPEKGSFVAFVVSHAKFGILDELRRRTGSRRIESRPMLVSLDSMRHDDGEIKDIVDRRATADTGPLSNTILRAIDELPPRRREVVITTVLSDQVSLADMARRYGLGESAVSTQKRKALNQIRAAITE